MPTEPDVAHRISDIFVDTLRAQAAFGRLNELMERGWEKTFCRALLLLGPARCGKTHILQEWIRRRTEADPDFRALISEVPAACTLKGMVSQLLEDLGDPNPSFGDPIARTRRVATHGQGMSVIILDEVQRLVDPETGKVKRDVAAWITNLLNKRICPVVLAGESHAAMVFEGVVYAEGRLLGQVLVDPYDWRTEQTEFRVFLRQLESKLGMKEASNLSAPEVALRLHMYSEGRIGLAANVISEGRAIARKAGRERITVDDLANGTDLLRIGAARDRPNPFRIANPMPGGEPPPQVQDVEIPVAPARGRFKVGRK